MRNLFIMILISSNFFAATCYETDCTGTVQSSLQMNKTILKKAYESLNAAMDKLFQEEEKYKKKLEAQNELLLELETLEKLSAENDKELSFILNKNNKILDKIIDIDLTEKLIKIEEENK